MTERTDPNGPTVPSGAPPVIELIGVERTFGGDPPVKVLRGVNLRVAAGESVSIVGPSGSGKSTLLNVLGLLDIPTGGTYRLDGIDVAQLSDGERAALRGTKLGFVFQSFHLLSHRTVLENVMLAELYLPDSEARGGGSKVERKARAVRALDRVGLGHRLDYTPPRMSGGERQRAAIARAIVHAPSLLLADEPTGNLDSENTVAVLELFDDLRHDGLTVCIITHDDSVAEHADRTVRMYDGVLTDVVREPVASR